MKASQFATVSLIAAHSIGWAAAQSDQPNRNSRREAPNPLVEAIDLDKNGIVSAAEMEKASASLLALDKDEDGKLSRNEIGATRGSSRRGRRGESGDAPARGRGDRRGGGGGGGARPTDIGASPLDLGEPGIAWYGRLDVATKEAARSNRPILFMSAASQCNGVPGVF